MEFAHDDVLTLLYAERQLIVVASDEAVDRMKSAATGHAAGNPAMEAISRAFTAGASALLPRFATFLPLVPVAAALTFRELRRLRERSSRADLPYLVITSSQARNLSFPNGHPRRQVVYAGDPGVAGKYYPVASFHRVLFEGKLVEALRLLRSLQATEISIEYLEGFNQAAGVDLSMAAPGTSGVKIGGGAGATSKTSSGARATMKLAPTMPAQVPTDLIWFQSEPLWQEVANARLESGLREFTIDVNYTDDFGINAKLKAKIANVGLDVGGTFTEYRETRWKLSGTFATPADASAK